MTRKIVKLDLRLDDESMQLPRGAEVLSAQAQDGRPVLWALVDPDEPKVLCKLQLVKTSVPAPAGLDRNRHMGSFEIAGETYHMFQVTQ